MFDMNAVTALAVALGCGLLVGIERERRKGDGPHRTAAGVRSFVLATLCGAVAMLLDSPALVAVGAAFFAAVAFAAWWRDTSGDPGMTTEIALWLTYLIGVLAVHNAPLAAGVVVTLTAVLAAREPMHNFAKRWLQPAEVRDGIILAGLTLIALPLAPDQPLWGQVLNPRVLMNLFVLLLTLQAMAHVARRLMQARHAAALSAVASGFISSTATIATLGTQVRAGHMSASAAAGAGLLTCTATMLQMLAVAATVRPDWLPALWAPALAGAAVVGVWGWLRLGQTPAVAAAQDASQLFNLRAAALVALALTGAQAGVQLLTQWLGSPGLLAGAMLAALADIHAAAAALFAQASGPPQQNPLILQALILAFTVHTLNKSVFAAMTGGRTYALALLPGLLAQIAVFAGLLWWLK
jgi:uncharacterized membrane protein (DUF4010 family)